MRKQNSKQAKPSIPDEIKRLESTLPQRAYSMLLSLYVMGGSATRQQLQERVNISSVLFVCNLRVLIDRGYVLDNGVNITLNV